MRIQKGLIDNLFLSCVYTIHGQHIAHNWGEIYFIDTFLAYNTFSSLIETGTYKGGLTLILGLHALRMNAEVLTIDILDEPMFDLYEKLKPILPIKFFKGNALGKEAKDLINKYIARGRTLLYCDGGHKAIEFKRYIPLLKRGDIIIAHDCPKEITLEVIVDEIEKYNLIRLYKDLLSSLHSKQLVFEKGD